MKDNDFELLTIMMYRKSVGRTAFDGNTFFVPPFLYVEAAEYLSQLPKFCSTYTTKISKSIMGVDSTDYNSSVVIQIDVEGKCLDSVSPKDSFLPGCMKASKAAKTSAMKQ